jgi:phosphoribosyl-dephospho-CoA transferase
LLEKTAIPNLGFLAEPIRMEKEHPFGNLWELRIIRIR